MWFKNINIEVYLYFNPPEDHKEIFIKLTDAWVKPNSSAVF